MDTTKLPMENEEGLQKALVVYASYEDATMTVKWSDGKTDKYTGSCTVWYKEPYMNRCSTSMECLLCDLWKYHQKWNGAYPESHKQHFG